MKHHAVNTVLPVFVFVAVLGSSCSQKDKKTTGAKLASSAHLETYFFVLLCLVHLEYLPSHW